jgi:hypothetical protein
VAIFAVYVIVAVGSTTGFHFSVGVVDVIASALFTGAARSLPMAAC